MESSLWLIFIVNIGINSLFSFFTLSLLIFFAVKILRIKNPRLQAFCFMIPFVKLIVDLGCYQFSSWALAQQINPLTSPEGTRFLTVIFWLAPLFHHPLCSIHFSLEEGQTFTLADLLCLHMGPSWTMTAALGLLIGSLCFLVRGIYQVYLSSQYFKRMRSTSTLYAHPLQDSLLQSRIQRKKVAIYLTQTLHSPFIFGQWRPSIFIPHSLFDKLTPQEFEAVIAHEMAHLQHGDLAVNAALFWICHLFWWIPTGYFKKRLNLAQEYACDRLLDTQLHRLSLAQAIYKSADWLYAAPLPVLAQLLAAPHHAVKRLQALLKCPNQEESKPLKWIKLFFLISWITSLFFGKFWTF